MFFVGPGGPGTVESAGCGVIRRHAVRLQPLPSLRPGRFGIFSPFQPSSQPRRCQDAPSPTLMALSILLFDRHGHPVVPTCERLCRRAQWSSRMAAGHRAIARREASLTVASTAALSTAEGRSCRSQNSRWLSPTADQPERQRRLCADFRRR